MKPLHELIEASEPKESGSFPIHIDDDSIEILEYVDREYAVTLKQIAVELAKELDNYVSFFDQDSDSSGRRLISKCRELLGEK